MRRSTFLRLAFIALGISLSSLGLRAQEYRSKASGNWNALGTWEQDNGSGWVDATVIPTNASGAITIRAPHSVTVTANVSLDDVTIEAGGTVTTTATGTTTWTIANGTYGVKVFGTFNANASAGSFGCCGSVSVENGGVINQNAGGSFYGPTVVQEGGTVVGNTPINLAGGAVVNNGTWTMTGSNALTTSAGGSFTNNGILTLRGYSLAGTLTNNGTINWSAGVISGSGSGNIQNTSGAVFNISFAGVNQLQRPFTNQTGATINYTNAGIFNTWSGTTFNNAGTLNVVNGVWQFIGTVTNSGTLHIPSGRFIQFDASATLNAGTSITGGGTIVNQTGTVAQNFPWTNSTHTFNMNGGAWTNSTGNPTVFDVGSAFNWTGGTLAGSGGYSIAAGLTAAFSTTASKTLNSALTNNGTINWSGGVIGGSGTITNAAGAEFNISFAGVNQLQRPFTNQAGATINYTNAGVFNTWSGTTFTNAGTLNVVNGVWQFMGTVSNSGTLHIPSGRSIQFDATASLNAGTSITGGGTIVNQTGTVAQNFPWTNSTHTFNMNGGAWTNSTGNPTVFDVGSAFNWTGGTLAGSGGYSIAAGLTAAFSTTASKTLNSALTNNGTINWSGGVIGGSGTITNAAGAEFNISFAGVNQLQRPFTNQAGATINYTNAGVFNTWSGTTFTNAGTLNVVNGVWQFMGTVSNSGTLHIPSGRSIQFDATASLNAGTSITGGGTIMNQTGTVAQNFPWTNSTHTFNMNGGAWTNSTGNPTVFDVGSAFNWTGGTLAGTAGYTIENGSTGTFSTAANKTLNSLLTNNGTINWNAGVIANGTGGTILNASEGIFNIQFTSTNQLQAPFTNQPGGVVNLNGSGTFTTFNNSNGTFTNNGTIDLVNGNWTFQSSNSHSASSVLNIGASRTLTFTTAPSSFAGTVNNSGTLAGTITSFTGTTFTNNGSVTLTNLPFAGTAAQTLDGTGSITNLTLNNANGLTLGGTQTVTNTLTLTNGRITLGNNDLILSNTALAGLVGGNATNHFVTNGTGAFHRQLPIGGANYPFPIGTGTSYLPVTLSNTSGPAERFGARVANDVHMEYSAPGVPDGPVVLNDQVERTWTLSELTEGGNQATVQLQWNTADEGANFDRANSGLHAYNGTDWVALTLGAAGGSNPYTRSATGLTAFREFTVADGESTLAFSCPGGVIPGTACDDEDDCTTNDVVNAECDCVGIFQDSDNDGTCNAEDGCPNDANKTEPGACGCGVADVPQIYYVDGDGDGYGAGAPVDGFVCVVPAGHVTNNTDCNDANATVYPGAPELCDELDNNCNGQVDELTSFSNGLVAQWLFNGNLNDRSANANNGSAPSGSSFTTGMDGTANGAFQFGGGRYVVVPHNAAYNFGTGDFTYSAWLKWNSTSYASVIDKNDYAGGGINRLNCFVDYPAAGNFMGRPGDVVAGTGLGNNTWRHVVMTRTGTTIRIYLNGVLSSSSTISPIDLNNSSSIFIGRHGNSDIQFYTGAMDNLRLYNRALSAEEVAELRLHELAGNVDGVSEVTYYTDADGDGYGDPATIGSGCTQPPGTVLLGGDCDDTDENINPGASEICDGLDNNCANGVDDGLAFVDYWPDTDADGFGDASASSISACTPPANHVTNNTDACPNDPLKQLPGACGCGNVEVDTDGDTTPDCIDACPNDPLKIAPLQCGCGNLETDSDNDGTADCVDACPNDPLKTTAGQCGCGNPDTDSDGDGIADCVDDCPSTAGTIGSPCNDDDATTGNDALNASCECEGQLIDCLGVPGGSALAGTACTTAGLPGIWSASCVCELEGPDVLVQNVSAPNDTIAGDEVVTLSFEVYNNGNADATVNWTERFYMESEAGALRTQIGQSAHSSGSPLAAGATLGRSVQITMPALINVGDQARFVVELVPGTGLIELPNSVTNNTGTQATPWVVRKQIRLLVPQPALTEGAAAGVPITVQRTGSISNAQVVSIGIDESERFTFPSTVTILAGQAARSFTLVAMENALLEGTIPAVLTASATGFSSATRNLTILDNEAPALSFSNVPATTGEGTSVTFQVSTNFAPASALQVFLTSSDQARFPVPASVTIAANTTSANVTVNLPQDQLPELDITVNLTAGAANHTAANASLQLTDDDLPGLQLVLQTDTVSESGGAFAVQATLQRTAGSPAIAFTAVITPSLANTLLLPTSISLAANASQQTFTIGVIDNALVDGFRTVTINAAVQLAGCGCNAPVSTAANVSADLTVADNDGPTLTMSVNPATLAEGLANAGTIRVQRNTATTAALDVALISSDVTELTVPATVSIPIGSSFVDVPATTVNDGTPDGSQQVYVQATADGFSPGITWCIVTDVNQPDLLVSAVTPSASPWPALVPFTWQATISNTGFANSIAGVPVRGVLSQNNIVDASDPVLFDYTINTPVPAGGSVQISGAAVAPNLPGTHKLLLQVNPGASATELTYTNNTSAPVNVSIAPSYTATAQVAGTTFLRGTTIPVTGTAVRPDASPAANESIEVYVLTNGLRREVLTTTDATGAFTASFVPLANESGHYTIGASFPGMGQTTEQDAFDIHGVRINNGQYPQFITLIGDTLTGTLAIQNLSDAPLTNLTLTPLNVPAGSTFSFTTIASLAGGASTTVAYEVSGTVVTPGYNFQPGTLQVTADQGMIQSQDLYYYCMVPGGHISADITSINTTVSQAAGQQLVQFRIVNTGGGNTGALSLSLPQVPWLQAMTPVNMGSMAPGDTALVILRFLADASVPFDFPINGTIAINGANSNSLVIPFTFTKVSVTTGNLTVDAVNQFTFFDEDEPHVEGANVEVRHAYSNALLAQGTTDTNGLVSFANLPEGQHRLLVSKPQHLPSEQLVTINAGASLSQTVFLNYQAITFGWSVVPTTVQDQYDVTLTMQFETNVPIPVVTIDMPDTMPQLFGDEVYAFNVTLTNHGLITAEDVELILPTHPEYEFLTNYGTENLAALSSIQVPVLMRLRDVPLATAEGSDIVFISQLLGMNEEAYRDIEIGGFTCKLYTYTRYHYNCNEATGLYETTGKESYIKMPGCVPTASPGNGFQPPPPPPPPDCDCELLPWCCQTYGPTPTGGADCIICVDPPVVNARIDCACVSDLLGVISCLPLPDPLTAVFGVPGCVDAIEAEDNFEIFVGCIAQFLPEPASNVIGDLDCLRTAYNAFKHCFRNSPTSPAMTFSSVERDGPNGAYQQPFNDLEQIVLAWEADSSLNAIYYVQLIEREAIDELIAILDPYISTFSNIPASAQTMTRTAISGSDIGENEAQWFMDRWNETLLAWNQGITAPDAQHPDIIDRNVVESHIATIIEVIDYASQRGYGSISELYGAFMEFVEEISTAPDAVCASVTVQLSQTVTMTREAFTGTLDIFNGHPTDGIDSLSVDILITDPDGVPSNGLFQINTEQLTGLSDVTGTGQIPSQEHGIVQFLFIPEPGAAPTVPVPYSFGGSVTYWDPYNQEMTTIQLAGITLTVNPSPDLMLHYFMERNILGDDALTSPDVEPSIPAELAVMIENHGYGAAQNMKISSAQPEIVENESGLAINFELTGSNLQGQPAQLGVLDIPFGTIPPLQTRVGQWWFTSSLLGKFVSYEAEVVHANSFGNPELSLIQGVELHELTRSIREYGPLADAMNDFLVNDQFDVNDVPDIIYFSQGRRTAEVLPAAAASFNAPVTAPTFTNTLTVQAEEPGWNYTKLNDPGNGDYDIVSVTRNSDAQAIPLDNAWLTFVTLPVSQQPVYEDKFHFVDTLATTTPTTYTIVWAPKNTDVPAVDTIIGAPASISALQVTQLTVVFDKAIDPATFTTDDLTLTFQGGPDIMDNSAIITQVDPFTFTVDLTPLTTGDGLYQFIAQAAGITDIYGIAGVAGRQVTWTQFISVPAIVAFQGLPGGTTDDEFSTIELLFNRPIDETSLTASDISITLGGVPQPGALSITRQNSDSTLFLVSGLENAITTDGAHLFTVNMPTVLSTEGVTGIQAQSVTLTRDTQGPTIAELTPLFTGGLDAQHRTGVNIRFSEPATGLTIGAIALSRDGNSLPLTAGQLTQVDPDEWRVSGFGLASYLDGDYAFTVDATGVTDAIGNAGSGTANVTWEVDRSTPIAVTNVGIDPDLGISNSDGITSSGSFNALFNLNADAAQVTIAQTSFGSEQVLVTLQDLSAGTHAVPVTFPTGGNTGLKVTAVGNNGGSAAGTRSLFIDQAPLSASWQTANNQSLTTDLSSATIQFSAAVLDPGAIASALGLRKNGLPVPAAMLTVTPVNSTTYSIGNLPAAANGTGSYELTLDAALLNKSTSGIGGAGIATLNWTVVPSYSATLRARVFLEGPYASGSMHDSLRTLIDFPLIEPFTTLGYGHVGGGGGETTTPQVLAVPGNDAIVDWVLVELRDRDDNTAVVASRSALLQRDGDVVAMDGFSPVTISVGAGAYYVALRHRNHLGVMSADSARFYTGSTQVDFTLLSTATYGTEGQKQVGARRALWAGDVNFNGMVQYVGEGNDRDPILVSIGGSTPTSTALGYLPTDVNLDGRVKYVGEGNDRDPILVNIGGSMPTNIRDAQLPQP